MPVTSADREIGARQAQLARLRALVAGSGLRLYAQVAELIHVSPHAIHAWMKPPTSASSSIIPEWAIELLALKTNQEVPPK